ncbi:MAG: CxxxxCH/CxxCH domain-containing protein [Bacteroidota bacterium]
MGTIDVIVPVHPEGWTEVTSPEFHGELIRATQWDLKQCQQCHGREYSGGTSRISCEPCHAAPDGPEACFTCHGSANNPAPPLDLDDNMESLFPGVAAHQEHLVSALQSKPMACSECHIVPTEMHAAGHVGSDLPAELIFGGPLGNAVTNEPTTEDYDLLLPTTTPDPSYDIQTMTCSGSYCHGNFKNGNNFTVAWTMVGTGEAECGTCHGGPSTGDPLPKTVAEGGSHPGFPSCSLCHGDVVDDNLNIIDQEKHVNGKLNVFGTERDS